MSKNTKNKILYITIATFVAGLLGAFIALGTDEFTWRFPTIVAGTVFVMSVMGSLLERKHYDTEQ